MIFVKTVKFRLRLLHLHNIYEIEKVRVIDIETGDYSEKLNEDFKYV